MAQADGVTGRQRLLHAGLNAVVFGVCYLLANLLAQQAGVTRDVALPLDASIPFLPWLVLPYLSSGPIFIAAFFAVRDRDALRVLSERLLLATVSASMVFVAYPLRFSTPRPAIASPLAQRLFEWLGAVDAPYNQLPSLHVAFCVILWVALRELPHATWSRALLGAWLTLTAAATVFTHQHHLLDVAGGFALGLLCLAVVRPARVGANIGLYYVLAGGAATVVGTAAWPWPVTLYLTTCLWLVALAYLRGNRTFLHKTRGRHPWWIWGLYAPYLAGYRLTWLAVRWRERGRPALRQVAAGLWIGRRLRADEAVLLPPRCTVIDLAPELPETGVLRGHSYRHFPLLDIVDPPMAAVQDIVATVRDELAAGRSVYLHCAMGHRRCVGVAAAYLAAVSTSTSASAAAPALAQPHSPNP